MDGDDYQAIRDAYYKAIEGLQTLADALERVVAPTGDEVGPMLAEHLIACSAINAMNSSELPLHSAGDCVHTDAAARAAIVRPSWDDLS